jgi:DNA-binding NtrC family response regulator
MGREYWLWMTNLMFWQFWRRKFGQPLRNVNLKRKLESKNYDVVVLDIMGVRGFDLLDLAVKHNLPVAMLTAHALNPESLKRSIEMRARAYLPKEKLGEIVPFLEDILEEPDSLSGWARQMNKLEGYFESRWGQDWQKTEARFWKDFEKKTSHIK